ncbi:MAG: hypothetical protein O2780_19115 [Proteobacteria bacterium]|jgi:hypothetical protein|nr:hypothetical protein [Pseudomonadota bacterium]MDA1300544.1 hypothetical protein [Pseudomonadota bacterium]
MNITIRALISSLPRFSLQIAVLTTLLVTVWQSAVILAASLLVLQVDGAGPGVTSSERNIRTAAHIAPWYPPPSAALSQWYIDRYQTRGDTDDLVNALEETRRLTSLQPAVAEHWAATFTLKGRLGEYDAEFMDALQIAAGLGPWEPVTAHLIIDGGTDAWAFLSPPARDIVMQIAINSLSNASNWLRPDSAQILLDRHFMTPVCRHLNPVAAGAIYCQQSKQSSEPR